MSPREPQPPTPMHPESRPRQQSSTQTQWHALEVDDALARLDSHGSRGLDPAQAEQRLATVGANSLQDQKTLGPLRILWNQLRSVLVLVLLLAAGISAALGDILEASAIFVIVVMFSALGFLQEYRAERAIAALRRLARPKVVVTRGGMPCTVEAAHLVPGDIVVLEAGSVVPADGRILDASNLRIQESALTGESEAVEKNAAALPSEIDVPLADQVNMAFMGTSVTYGRGAMLITATGMATGLGKIANLIQNVTQNVTPLQRQLDRVGTGLAWFGGAIALLVGAIAVGHGANVSTVFLTAVSVAVAVVPEGLPAVVTVTLALGSQRLLKRRALMRRLPAVETLGAVTHICSDKTGTLTQNRMTVCTLEVMGQRLDLTPEASPPAKAVPAHPGLLCLLQAGVLCNDAQLDRDGTVLGDPTEGAMLTVAKRLGLDHPELRATFPRVHEQPFDAERKRMTTVHRRPSLDDAPLTGLSALFSPQAQSIAVTKGSVDGLLPLCNRILGPDEAECPLNPQQAERIQAAHDRFAQQGMRVLGVALATAPDAPMNLEQDLVFLGMFALLDPPRPEVGSAIHTCLRAGIRPVMITGDHPLTAQHIARQLGLAADPDVLTGHELDTLAGPALEAAVATTSVFARVTPEHKLRIVECLQKRGEIVAMTGDGVNDAPALRKADIGIAMGVSGTDVAKEAADMVLLDDNFTTIVAAVEEGRMIFANIQRFVKFSIAGNVAKVWVMLVLPFCGTPIGLTPLQLLWLNLLTDGLLGLGLGLEAAPAAVMERAPRASNAPFFSGRVTTQVLAIGTLIGGVALAAGLILRFFQDATWHTVLFTALAFMQVAQALAARSSTGLSFKQNTPLLALSLLTIGLQLTALYAPWSQPLFQVQTLTAADLGLCAGLGLLVFLVLEAARRLSRGRRAASSANNNSPSPTAAGPGHPDLPGGPSTSPR